MRLFSYSAWRRIEQPSCLRSESIRSRERDAFGEDGSSDFERHPDCRHTACSQKVQWLPIAA